MKYSFSSQLERIPPSGIRKFFDLVSASDDPEMISLSVGEPDFCTPWDIRKKAINALEDGLTGYTSNRGSLDCLFAISDYMNRQFSCSYDPHSEILITNGVSEGIDIALRALINPGDEVIIPKPAYVCYDPLTRLAGATVVSIDTTDNGFIPDPSAIEKAITPKTKLLLLSSPSNPTGVVIPPNTLEEIADVVKRHNLLVLSDEIYAELDYEQLFRCFSSLPGMKERTLIFNGLSKAFAMTGWRLGFVCGPEPLIDRLLKIHQYSALCSPILSQLAATEALTHSDEYVHEMKLSYLKRRNTVIKRFKDIGFEMAHPSGAFYCFPSIQNFGMSSEDFAIALFERYKVAVVPGNAFGDEGEGFIRCCYSTDPKLLEEALDRIERFVKEL